MQFLNNLATALLAFTLAVHAAPTVTSVQASAPTTLPNTPTTSPNTPTTLPNAPALNALAPNILNGPIPTKVTCGTSQTYTAAQISAAVKRAGQYELANTVGLAIDRYTKKVVKSKGYPHVFNNREALSFLSACNSQTLQEFPILPNGQTFISNPSSKRTSKRPGLDRIVYTFDSGTSTLQYCGVMTHSGAIGNSFVPCVEPVASS